MDVGTIYGRRASQREGDWQPFSELDSVGTTSFERLSELHHLAKGFPRYYDQGPRFVLAHRIDVYDEYESRAQDRRLPERRTTVYATEYVLLDRHLLDPHDAEEQSCECRGHIDSTTRPDSVSSFLG